MRFSFGKNWQSYSENALTKAGIKQFRHDFQVLFKGIELKNKTFIDVGFGQGLSLLTAMELGAEVVGIDIDKDNIIALDTSRREMGIVKMPDAQVGSILDDDFVMQKKGRYDIVHSWGVLHHTGDMAKALENACSLVADEGYFVCSIYNRHWSSSLWKIIKYLYNRTPLVLQKILIALFYPIIFIAKYVVTGKNPTQKERGMDFFYDVIDWVGGYPYEYASEDEIKEIVSKKGFICIRTCPAIVPTGCNEFIFKKAH